MKKLKLLLLLFFLSACSIEQRIEKCAIAQETQFEKCLLLQQKKITKDSILKNKSESTFVKKYLK